MLVDRHELGQRLRALRAGQGRTVAAVAADAGLSVPYVANLENGRGNPTLEVLNRLAHALGSPLTVGFGAPETSGGTTLPAALVRLSRGPRFRRDVQVIAEATGEEPGAVLEALARTAAVIHRELAETDWLRLLDALVLVAAHPQPR
jgi:transcriptional regulator with XRE-family HTH domain